MMCTLTQLELDFLAGLKTGWWRLYRRELARLLKSEAKANDAEPNTRPIAWRVISG